MLNMPFSQLYLCIKPALPSPPKILSSTFFNFHLPVPPLLVHKVILTTLNNTPFLYTSLYMQFFTSLLLRTTIRTICTKNIFSLTQPFSRFRLHQGTKEPESLVRTDTVLISSFFHKVWSMKTGLRITDSLLLRLIKLVYCRWQSLMKMLAIGMANYPIHLLSYPQTIVITSITY